MAPAICDHAASDPVAPQKGEHSNDNGMPPFSPPRELSPCMPRSFIMFPETGTFPEDPSNSLAVDASPQNPNYSHNKSTIARLQGSTAQDTVSTISKDTTQHNPPPAYLTEQTVWTFLQQLPTRADFEALANRVESALRGELQVLKQEVSKVDDRVAALERDKGAMAHTVDHLQSAHTDLSDKVVQLHLLLDGL